MAAHSHSGGAGPFFLPSMTDEAARPSVVEPRADFSGVWVRSLSSSFGEESRDHSGEASSFEAGEHEQDPATDPETAVRVEHRSIRRRLLRAFGHVDATGLERLLNLWILHGGPWPTALWCAFGAA